MEKASNISTSFTHTKREVVIFFFIFLFSDEINVLKILSKLSFEIEIKTLEKSKIKEMNIKLIIKEHILGNQ